MSTREFTSVNGHCGDGDIGAMIPCHEYFCGDVSNPSPTTRPVSEPPGTGSCGGVRSIRTNTCHPHISTVHPDPFPGPSERAVLSPVESTHPQYYQIYIIHMYLRVMPPLVSDPDRESVDNPQIDATTLAFSRTTLQEGTATNRTTARTD